MLEEAKVILVATLDTPNHLISVEIGGAARTIRLLRFTKINHPLHAGPIACAKIWDAPVGLGRNGGHFGDQRDRDRNASQFSRAGWGPLTEPR